MKYRNKSENDLIIAGRFVKAGEEIEFATIIENPNFEAVTDGQPQTAEATPQPSGVPPVQAPQDNGQSPAAPAPQAAAPTPAPTADNTGGATS